MPPAVIMIIGRHGSSCKFKLAAVTVTVTVRGPAGHKKKSGPGPCHGDSEGHTPATRPRVRGPRRSGPLFDYVRLKVPLFAEPGTSESAARDQVLADSDSARRTYKLRDHYIVGQDSDLP